MLLPLIVSGSVWLKTPACGALITSSAWPIALRRTVPVHATLLGRLAGQPDPFAIVPDQLPNSGSLAACVTVTVWPAIVTVPVRVSPVFSAMVRPTVAVPLPVDPEFTTMNDALDVAVHAQPLFTLTPTDAVAPVAAMFSVLVDSVNVQLADGVGVVGVRVSEQAASNGKDRSSANEIEVRMDRA